MMTVVC